MTTDCSLNYKFNRWKFLAQNMEGRTWSIQKLFLTFRTIFVHNMFSPCSAKRRDSDKDLPVSCLLIIFPIFIFQARRSPQYCQWETCTKVQRYRYRSHEISGSSQQKKITCRLPNNRRQIQQRVERRQNRCAPSGHVIPNDVRTEFVQNHWTLLQSSGNFDPLKIFNIWK